MDKTCRIYANRRGVALVMSLVFLLVISALSLGMFTTSSTNAQVAVNHVQANRARIAAESGLEFVKYWMSRIHLSGNIAPQNRYVYLKHYLAVDMVNHYVSDVVENAQLWIGYQSGGIVVNGEGDLFMAVLESVDNDRSRIVITGISGSLQRTLSVEFRFGVRQDSVFNFGVATKGPLNLQGNILLTGVNLAVESDVYIESDNDINALSIIGNSQIAGDVTITNPNAVVTLQGGNAGIGGETGEEAIANHVVTGAPHTQFPYPNAASFEHYATGEVITTSTDLSKKTYFDNAKIAAGTNPTFNTTTLRGILYIESPNIVTFGGNVDITGIIVARGSWTDNSGVNKIIFQGNVSSHSVTELPEDTRFAGLRNEQGTFLMAPGYSLSFGGNFGTLNGAIAGNGVTFFGNAGGTIAGSVINYSTTPMTVSGNTDLYFNRSGVNNIPAGFLSEIVMHFDPASYSEYIGSM